MAIHAPKFWRGWETPGRAPSVPITKARSVFIWTRTEWHQRVGKAGGQLWNFRLAGFLRSRLVIAERFDDESRLVGVGRPHPQYDSADAGKNVLRRIEIRQKAFNFVGFKQSLHYECLGFIAGIEHPYQASLLADRRGLEIRIGSHCSSMKASIKRSESQVEPQVQRVGCTEVLQQCTSLS